MSAKYWKDMKRSDWSRCLKKDYIAKDLAWNAERGQMSLSVLRELTAPLTIHYDFGDVLIADRDYGWLQIALKDRLFWLTAMFDRAEALVELYFDIANGICFDDPENPRFEDMYLDIVAAGDTLSILDGDELEEALENGDVTREEYDRAWAVCRELYAYLQEHRAEVFRLCGEAYRELKAAMDSPC